ncbi:MAG: hypothetical protein ACYCOU_14835 [Sulfobacillus sp.]
MWLSFLSIFKNPYVLGGIVLAGSLAANGILYYQVQSEASTIKMVKAQGRAEISSLDASINSKTSLLIAKNASQERRHYLALVAHANKIVTKERMLARQTKNQLSSVEQNIRQLKNPSAELWLDTHIPKAILKEIGKQ